MTNYQSEEAVRVNAWKIVTAIAAILMITTVAEDVTAVSDDKLPPDSPPPPVTRAGCGVIEVSWSSVDNAAEYCVYRDGLRFVCTSDTLWRDNNPGILKRCYQVTARNFSGESALSGESCAVADIPPPPTPSVASVVAGCGYIDMSWLPVNGATKYCIYRDGGHVDCVAATSWRDNNPGDAQRCYQVSAANHCGESDKSGQVCGTAEQVPDNPDTLACVPIEPVVNMPFKLSWPRIDGAARYELTENNVSIYSGPDTSITLIRNTEAGYFYILEACNDCGCSALTADLTVDIVLDVQNMSSSELPDAFYLSPCYPNPFNMETRIRFALQRPTHVTIQIYNLLGMRVRTLVDGYLSAGHKITIWDGRDDSGFDVSSGVYFCRMVAGDFAETGKLVLMK